MIRSIAAGAASALAFTCLSHAQEERTADQAFFEGRYLEWIELFSLPEEIPPEVRRDIMAQMRAWQYSALGRHADAYAAMNEADQEDYQIDPTPIQFSDLTARDAVEAIREAAAGHRVVILNEAHNDPRHRATAAAVLRGLAADGFTHFAVEAFSAPWVVDRVVRDGYPNRQLGAYTAEPVFADLVRTALELDMSLVQYEQRSDQECPGDCSSDERMRYRERAQAANLAETLAAAPEGRFVVFVGYNHLDETGDEDGDGVLDGWMASELAAATGLDPLTIDQEAGTGYGLPHNESIPDALVAHFDVATPTVFQQSDGRFLNRGHGRQFDILLVHPEFSIEDHGRANWLSMQGYRKPHTISASVLPEERPILLQAFVVGETGERLPMDQRLVLDGETTDQTLMLPAGYYELVVQRSGQADLDLGEITITAED